MRKIKGYTSRHLRPPDFPLSRHAYTFWAIQPLFCLLPELRQILPPRCLLTLQTTHPSICTHLVVHPPIHPSTHSYTHPSTPTPIYPPLTHVSAHSPTHTCIHLSIHPLTHLPIHTYTYIYMHTSTHMLHPSIHPSNHQPSTCLFIHLSIHLPTCPYFYP